MQHATRRVSLRKVLGVSLALVLILGAFASPASADPVGDANAELAALNYQLEGSSSLPAEIDVLADVYLDDSALLGGDTNVKRCLITGTIRDMGYSKPGGSNTISIYGKSKIKSDCGSFWIPLIETEVTIWHTPPYGTDTPLGGCSTKGPYTDEGTGAGFGPVYADAAGAHQVGACHGTGSTMYWRFDFRWQGKGTPRRERSFCYEQKVFGDGPHPITCPVTAS